MANRLFTAGFGGFDRPHEFPKLTSPENNIKIITNVLSQTSNGEVINDANHAYKPLIDVSAREVQDAIETFFDDASTEDDLFIYLTGHGVNQTHLKDLVLASREANIGLIAEEKEAFHHSWGVSLRSHIKARARSTKAKTVNIILDCCHAGVAVDVVDNDGTAMRATTSRFETAIGHMNAMGNDSNNTKITYLMASDADHSAFEVPLDLTRWENKLIAEKIERLELDTEKKVSRFALGLLYARESHKIASELDRINSSYRSGELAAALEGAAVFRKIAAQVQRDDNGMASLEQATAGIKYFLEKYEPRQKCELLDTAKVGSSVLLFQSSGTSRSQRLNEIRKSLGKIAFITDRTKSSFESFLMDAEQTDRKSRKETDLLIEDHLYDAQARGDHPGMVELFILRNHDSDMRSQIDAAVRRRSKEAAVAEKGFRDAAQSLEEELNSVRTDLQSSESQSKEFENRAIRAERFLKIAIFVQLIVIAGMAYYILQSGGLPYG